MHCDRAEIRAVGLASVMLLIALLLGCGPAKVRVPDTKPSMQPPPADAMRPCPNAERKGEGSGVLPDVEDGARGALIRAATQAAGYWRTCDARHETLRSHINDYLQRQREHAMTED